MSGIKKQWLLMLVAVMGVTMSCQRTQVFTVSGHISGAIDQMLYLERHAIDSIYGVDSVLLSESGKFSFSCEVPEYPDFYRLRLGRQLIPFAVDSVLSLEIMADAQSFATSYKVEGSAIAEEMKSVWLAQLDANVKTSKLIEEYKEGRITVSELEASSKAVIEEYKEIAREYILKDPMSPVAYFALFQQIGGGLIFNIYDRKDSRLFAAVANVYDHYSPENPRSKFLYDLALRSIAVVKAQEAEIKGGDQVSKVIAHAGTLRTGLIDIALPSFGGDTVRLSEVAQGAPTVLAFTSMAAEWSGAFNEELRGLYEKYSSRGVKLYSVGLDSDAHIWKSAVSSLPWVNVWDREGPYSSLVGYYNLAVLPTLFVINAKGEIVQRCPTFEEVTRRLDKELN